MSHSDERLLRWIVNIATLVTAVTLLAIAGYVMFGDDPLVRLITHHDSMVPMWFVTAYFLGKMVGGFIGGIFGLSWVLGTHARLVDAVKSLKFK